MNDFIKLCQADRLVEANAISVTDNFYLLRAVATRDQQQLKLISLLM
ncbi:hypothetical protein [Candidatus Coxiella mudrowiae]|nr:hypothetical protein [Candidatus Coxiella mudrowiae]